MHYKMVMACHRTQGQKRWLRLESESRRPSGLELCPRSWSASHTLKRHKHACLFPSPHLLQFSLFADQFSLLLRHVDEESCLSPASVQQPGKKGSVNPNPKFPQRKSDWPSLGQVSTLIKFSRSGRKRGWSRSQRTGSSPALWN